MPAVTDHNRRDALAAAYAEIQLELGKYRRRAHEEAKAHIDTAIADATATGEPLDGTAVGRAAAKAALNQWLGPEPYETIDAPTVGGAGVLEPGPGS